MFQLLATKGVATNSVGEKFDVNYHLQDGILTIGDEIVIKNGSIELLRIIKKENEKDDLSYRYILYGAVFGISASIGAIFSGTYNELADFLLAFATNIMIFGFIGLLVGLFLIKEVTYFTFEVCYLKNNSIWTIRCHKVMYEVFKKFSVDFKSVSVDGSDSSNKSKSIIKNKVGQDEKLVSVSESKDSISKLEKYHDLYQRGVISEEEFNDVKKKILEKEMEK